MRVPGSLRGRLPVLEVLADQPGTLTMAFVSGRHGQDLIDQGRAIQVLHACGAMLRHLQATEPASVFPWAHTDDADAVLVHGDDGPNNVL